MAQAWQQMTLAWQQVTSLLWSIFSGPTLVDILDILIVAYLVYKLMVLTRETRATQVLKGLGVLLLLFWASDLLGFKALNWILQLVVNSGAVVLVVLFQPELRRALEQIGRSNFLDKIRNSEEMRDGEHLIAELTQAVTALSRRRVGALIVIEQKTGLKDIVESGTQMDALASAALLVNIFEPNTPLHDGAVILREQRIVAAACILRLSEDVGISRELGTRHRAALGISETTDAVALIVSEETGIISIARNGRLTRHLDSRSLTQVLTELYIKSEPNPLATLLTKRRGRHDAK